MHPPRQGHNTRGPSQYHVHNDGIAGMQRMKYRRMEVTMTGARGMETKVARLARGRKILHGIRVDWKRSYI